MMDFYWTIPPWILMKTFYGQKDCSKFFPTTFQYLKIVMKAKDPHISWDIAK